MSHAKHVLHAALGAVSILAIGVVLGVLLDRVVLLHGPSASYSAAASQSVDATHQSFLRELADDLGLTEAQATQVHEILVRHQAAVDEAWSLVHSRLESAIDSVTAEIEAVLEPGQRDRLSEWLRERYGESAHRVADERH